MKNGPESIENMHDGATGEDWSALEAGLREALSSQDPPAGFAERVLARAEFEAHPKALTTSPSLVETPAAARGGTPPPLTTGPTKVIRWPMGRIWMRGAVAAALLLALFEGESTYRRIREQQRRIAEATAQFQTTERVTLRALAQAREQLQKAGVPLNLD